MSGNEDDWLALKPQEPSPSQCCGSGCKPCIYDVYEKELAQWERAKAKQDKSLLMEKKEQVNLSSSHLRASALIVLVSSGVVVMGEGCSNRLKRCLKRRL